MQSQGRARRQAAQKKRGDVSRHNQYRISIAELLRKEQRTLLEIARGTICRGDLAPALCAQACQVEMRTLVQARVPFGAEGADDSGVGMEQIPMMRSKTCGALLNAPPLTIATRIR